MKKLISILLFVTTLVAFSSCKIKEEHEIKGKTIYQQHPSSYSETQTKSKTESADKSEIPVTDTEMTTDKADPSKWSAQEIVEFYKASAVKSQSKVKSVQKMTLKKLSVNDGDGALGKSVDFITPFFGFGSRKEFNRIWRHNRWI